MGTCAEAATCPPLPRAESDPVRGGEKVCARGVPPSPAVVTIAESVPPPFFSRTIPTLSRTCLPRSPHSSFTAWRHLASSLLGSPPLISTFSPTPPSAPDGTGCSRPPSDPRHFSFAASPHPPTCCFHPPRALARPGRGLRHISLGGKISQVDDGVVWRRPAPGSRNKRGRPLASRGEPGGVGGGAA